ncbi:MAG: acyl-CoA dehydrogenase family protein [Deltaproteobacteria bacterium]|nr:acyl-CoA dehydrogenase family protein [Deltaproteobacteria bacterium]
MIDLELTDAQQNVRSMLNWFAKTEMRPIALEADRTGVVPLPFLKKTMDLGLAGGAMGDMQAPEEGKPEKKGPKGANRIAVIGSEELAWGDAALILTFPGPGLGGPPVTYTGTPEQKERAFKVFREDRENPHWGAYALTEPGAGSDVANISTTCRKDGDHYILNGRKCYITNGARADWNVVFATLDKTQGRAAHRAFLVFKDAPGFSVGKIEDKLGLRASETAELVLEDCRVHKNDLLGGEERYTSASKEGFRTAMKTFDNTRPLVAAMAVGIARAAYEICRDWVKENYDLKRPIPRYHLIAEKLANMEREIHAARLLCWKAAWMGDLDIPNSREASVSKSYSAEVGQRVTTQAIEIMGYEGTYHHRMVEKLFRDVKVFDIFEGTGQIQRIVISRRILQGLTR